MVDVRSLSDRQLLDLLALASPLSKARAAFSHQSAKIDQAEMQRVKPDIFEIRRMEFEAAQAILRAYGAEE